LRWDIIVYSYKFHRLESEPDIMACMLGAVTLQIASCLLLLAGWV
jgi:hypothetical protein